MRHRAVNAAAVIGLPHKRLEEQVAALVQVKPKSPPEDATGDHQLTSLAPHPFKSQELPFAFSASSCSKGYCSTVSLQPMLDDTLDSVFADEAGGTSAEQLAQFCQAEGLAGFKVPRVIHLQQTPLPCNSSGKLLKHLVRQRLLELEGGPGTQRSRL